MAFKFIKRLFLPQKSGVLAPHERSPGAKFFRAIHGTGPTRNGERGFRGAGALELLRKQQDQHEPCVGFVVVGLVFGGWATARGV